MSACHVVRRHGRHGPGGMGRAGQLECPPGADQDGPHPSVDGGRLMLISTRRWSARPRGTAPRASRRPWASAAPPLPTPCPSRSSAEQVSKPSGRSDRGETRPAGPASRGYPSPSRRRRWARVLGSPHSVEASAIRRSRARDTQELRSGIPRGCGADPDRDREVDGAGDRGAGIIEVAPGRSGPCRSRAGRLGRTAGWVGARRVGPAAAGERGAGDGA